jgi:hypothetical protein
VGWVSFECVIIISTIKLQDRHLIKHSSHFIGHRAIFDLRLLNVSYLARVRKMEKRQDIQPDHFVDDFSLAKSSTRVTDAKKKHARQTMNPQYMKGILRHPGSVWCPWQPQTDPTQPGFIKPKRKSSAAPPSADAKAGGSKGVSWMAMGWGPWNKWF